MLSVLALAMWSETEAARLLLLPLGTGVRPLRLLCGALAGDDRPDSGSFPHIIPMCLSVLDLPQVNASHHIFHVIPTVEILGFTWTASELRLLRQLWVQEAGRPRLPPSQTSISHSGISSCSPLPGAHSLAQSFFSAESGGALWESGVL